ncbi:MAG: tetratricopeptide repeat protein [Planctomycetales bacterium]
MAALWQRRWGRWLAVGLLPIGAVGGYFAWKGWWMRDVQSRVDRAVEIILRTDPAWDATALAELEETSRRLDGLRERRFEQRLIECALRARSGDPEGALELLEKVRTQERLRTPQFLLAAEALLATGRLREAESVLRRLITDNPELWQAHRDLAEVYHAFGATLASLKELEEVARLHPDGFLAYRLMGMVYHLDLHRPEEAIGYYRQALERRPPERFRTAIQRELAQCLVLTEEYGAALELLESTPSEAFDWALLAECHWALGRLDEAQQDLDTLERIDPEHRTMLVVGAVLAIERAAPHEALPLLEKRLQQDPHDTLARYQLSRAYRQMGDQAASDAQSELLRQTQALRNQLDELYSRAIRQPTDHELREKLAKVSEQLGQSEQAVRWRHMAQQIQLAVEKP